MEVGGWGWGDAGLFQPKVKGTVWARQGSEWFYSSAAVFESAAFQQRGWRTRSAPSHLRALCCRWLFALVGVVAHFLGTNVDFALCIRAGETGEIFAKWLWPRGPWLADAPNIPLTCLLFSFFFLLPRPFCAAPSATVPVAGTLCVV